MYSFQPEQWTGKDFQDEGHNVKVKGQNDPGAHRTYVSCICPDNMKQLLFIIPKNGPDKMFKVKVIY